MAGNWVLHQKVGSKWGRMANKWTQSARSLTFYRFIGAIDVGRSGAGKICKCECLGWKCIRNFANVTFLVRVSQSGIGTFVKEVKVLRKEKMSWTAKFPEVGEGEGRGGRLKHHSPSPCAGTHRTTCRPPGSAFWSTAPDPGSNPHRRPDVGSHTSDHPHKLRITMNIRAFNV